jgi:hypothetical protein
MEQVTAALIPYGSARENIPGLSHLFEHLFCKYLSPSAKGYTTEDYIFIISVDNTIDDYPCVLRNINISEECFSFEKEVIYQEIKQGSKRKNDIFKKLWRNTIYESNPIGSISGIEKISVIDIKRHVNKILCEPFYISRSGVIDEIYVVIKNRINRLEYVGGYKERILNILCRDEIQLSHKAFKVVYFKNSEDIAHIMKIILERINRSKKIYFYERKQFSTFLYEKSCIWPGTDYMEENYKQITDDILNAYRNLNKSSIDKSLNELESIYYYNRKWKSRISAALNIDLIKLNEMEKAFSTG